MPSKSTDGRPWQIERDRFGLMFSGPLEIGEMIEVMPVSEHDRLREASQAVVEMLTGCSGLTHRYLGACPDPSQREARDEHCPARQAIDRLCAALLPADKEIP